MVYLVTGLLSLFMSLPAFSNDFDTTYWFTPEAKNLVYLKTHTGEVVILLSGDTAPTHKERFSDLVEEGFYDGKYFYRVIEGFVAQGGSNEENQPFALASPLKAEFHRSPIPKKTVVVEPEAPHAPATGYLNAMPVGIDKNNNQIWHTHCPGTVAFARDVDKNTATTEFYVVIGQAPRHLDKNMSVIGRVLLGLEHLQRLPRGAREKGGIINAPDTPSRIISVRLGTQLPAEKQRTFRIQTATHPDYQQKLANARNLDNPFFHDKSLTPRTIDVCYYQTSVEEITAK
ncbi:peptidylprolyl isomerase [Alteromonas sp. H39]|uniref:peptidylprolyl isomerase n=1 Tax=Alteromonas sp. H39 TaxID=3389876 RepID=UPI0039E09660